METTYDPILSGPEALPYLQVRRRPAAPLGVAMVLVSARGDLVAIPGGSPVPGFRFGNFTAAYYIDTAEHQLFLDAQLPSSDPGFSFQAHLSYRCRVSDAADVARRQLRDIGALAAPTLVAGMHGACRHLDITQAAEAKERIEEALRLVSCDPAVAVSGCGVELPLHGDEAVASGRRFREHLRDTRLTKEKTDSVASLLSGGNPALLAMHLANHPEDTGSVVEMLVAGEIAEARNMLQAISIVYGRGSGDEEPFESRDERRRLLDTFLARALPSGSVSADAGSSGLDGPFRRSRLRGSLVGSAPLDRPAIAAEVVSETDDTDAAREPLRKDERLPDRPDAPRSSRIMSSRPARRDPDSDEDG